MVIFLWGVIAGLACAVIVVLVWLCALWMDIWEKGNNRW